MRHRVLVTGAGGFIGRALVPYLASQGCAVSTISRSSAAMLGASSFRVDSFEAREVSNALSAARFDVVIHLAAYGVNPTDRSPAMMRRVNVDGVAAMVEVAAMHGAKGFVYAGSSAEYQASVPGIRLTEDGPLESKALYGASKAAGGLIGSATAQALGLPFLWLRIFGVMGPGEAPHRLAPAIAAKLLQGEPVPLSGGDQVRDILALADVVRGLELAANAAVAGIGGTFNLCSGQPVAIREVAQAAADALCRPRSLLEFGKLPYRADEHMWLVGNPDAFQALTGFSPSFGLPGTVARALSNGVLPKLEGAA